MNWIHPSKRGGLGKGNVENPTAPPKPVLESVVLPELVTLTEQLETPVVTDSVIPEVVSKMKKERSKRKVV